MKCRYCGKSDGTCYIECVDGEFTCGTCWLDRVKLHETQRAEVIEENKQKAEAKAAKKKTTTKRKVV